VPWNDPRRSRLATCGMTGYQERSRRSVLCRADRLMTAYTQQHRGETMAEDPDPGCRICVAGFAVRPSRIVSNYRAPTAASISNSSPRGIVSISGDRTPGAATLHLRDSAPCAVASSGSGCLPPDAAEQLAIVCGGRPRMSGLNLSAQVSVTERVTIPAEGSGSGLSRCRPRRERDARLRLSAPADSRCTCFPQDVTFDGHAPLEPNAVFYSNGPGDPAASETHVALLRRRCCARDFRSSASVSATNCSVPPSGSAPPQATVRPSRDQPARGRPCDRPGRNHLAQPRIRGRRAPLDGPFESPAGFRSESGVSHVNLTTTWSEGLSPRYPAFSVQYHEVAAGPHRRQLPLRPPVPRPRRGSRYDTTGPTESD
jgi:carbamoyl-phosphate synthase small subunit